MKVITETRRVHLRWYDLSTLLLCVIEKSSIILTGASQEKRKEASPSL